MSDSRPIRIAGVSVPPFRQVALAIDTREDYCCASCRRSVTKDEAGKWHDPKRANVTEVCVIAERCPFCGVGGRWVTHKAWGRWFPDWIVLVPCGLRVGDIAVLGRENEHVVDRKHRDWIANCGKEHERFEKELREASNIIGGKFAVMIEGNDVEIFEELKQRQEINPKAVSGKVIVASDARWESRYPFLRIKRWSHAKSCVEWTIDFLIDQTEQSVSAVRRQHRAVKDVGL